MLFRAPQFSDDEKICCRNVNNELHFFEDKNFGKIIDNIISQMLQMYFVNIYSFIFIANPYAAGTENDYPLPPV